MVVPEEGAFRCFKKVQDAQGAYVIIAIDVPASAKRLTAMKSRKSRVSCGKVRYAERMDGTRIKSGGTFHSYTSGRLAYSVGEKVVPDSFDDDPRKECTHGIHVFITKQEARDW